METITIGRKRKNTAEAADNIYRGMTPDEAEAHVNQAGGLPEAVVELAKLAALVVALRQEIDDLKG